MGNLNPRVHHIAHHSKVFPPDLSRMGEKATVLRRNVVLLCFETCECFKEAILLRMTGLIASHHTEHDSEHQIRHGTSQTELLSDRVSSGRVQSIAEA
jgi:hypothetical protein